jgi:hypothetical protein
MNKLEMALAAARGAVPECRAVGYVDMAQGALLGSSIVGNHPAEVLALVAAACGEMMQGPTVKAIEEQFRRARGSAATGHMIRRLTFETQGDNGGSGLFHLVLRCARVPEHALVFVCAGSANEGMVRAKAAIELPKVEAAL